MRSSTGCGLLFLCALPILLLGACGSSPKIRPSMVPPDSGGGVSSMAVRFDRMRGVPLPLIDLVVESGVTVSLDGIFWDSGIDLQILDDRVGLPPIDVLSLADVHS